MFKGYEALRGFSHISQKKGHMNAGCASGWTLPCRNWLSVRQWVECASLSFTWLKSWESSAPSLPLIAWFDLLLSCCVLHHRILYQPHFLLFIRTELFSPHYQKSQCLTAPHSTCNFPSLLLCTHEMNTLGLLIKSLLCSVSVPSLKNVTEVNQAIKFETSWALELL